MKKVKTFLLVFMLCAFTICTATVNAAPKQKLSKTNVTLCAGNTYRLKVKGTKPTKVKWKSSKKKVVKVSKKGVLTAKKAGKAVITAKVGSKTYKCRVKVYSAKLNLSYVHLHLGESTQLLFNTPTFQNQVVKYKTSNSNIAEVSPQGIVTAKGTGDATITVYVKEASVKTTIHVPKETLLDTKEATCSQEGTHIYQCSECGKKRSEIIPKNIINGHDYIKTIIKPTSKKAGYTEYVCKHNSSHMYRDSYVPAAGEDTEHIHLWDDGILIKKPTATEDGEKQYTCLICGQKETQVIDKITSNYSILTNKKVYTFGENISICAAGAKNSRIGLYKIEDNASKVQPIYQYYITDQDIISGEYYEIQKVGKLHPSRIPASSLPAGDYKVILYSDDDSIADYTVFTVEPSQELVFKSNKSTYKEGEDIYVTATGTDSDWVGLYTDTDVPGDPEQPGTAQSIYYGYVAKNGVTSGEYFEIKSQYFNIDRIDYQSLPAGKYKLILFKDASYEIIKELPITIEPFQVEISASYDLDNPSSGLADGTVSVSLSQDAVESAENIVMYWADDQGILTDYVALAKQKIKGTENQIKMVKNTIIPEKATRLLVYVQHGNKLSDNYGEVILPENCNYKPQGNLLADFQVLSDIHINVNGGSADGLNHFPMALKDISSTFPESNGIFINGDIADSGHENEYAKMEQIVQSINHLPNVYLAIGNHDYNQGTDNAQSYFKKYAKTDSIYYDKVINNYHYIMLGSEQQGDGLRAFLSDAQLNWLDQKLSADTLKDPTKPVFVFLHQSLDNTVAGSLPGQGWSGVDSSCSVKLRNILKKYPQVVLFNGHSHWEMDSEQNMYERTAELPTIFNTASVAYLWTSYDVTEGVYLEGSQGYDVRVYSDRIEVWGRDFVNNKYIPSAVYVVKNINAQ